jgi:formylglycine-generating enzyme required for sulfatase activity
MFRSLLCLTVCALLISTAASIDAAERYAFLVGVRQYDRTQLNALQYTENDVTQLAGVLARGGYRKANVVLMTQTVGASETRFLPIAKNIRKELDLLLREVGAGDSLLVALSGHGVQYEAGGDSYFCPADADLTDRASLIPLGAVYQSLAASQAAVKVLLVDACRNDPLSSLARSRRVVDLETLSRQPQREPPGGIAALFSCSRGEQSFEHPELQHGIFFHYIIQGLSGQADLDKDQEISLAELEQFSVKEVQRFARRQLAVAQTPERRGEARGLLTLASAAAAAPLPVLIEEHRPGQMIENFLGMKLVAVPAGEFLQGSTPAEVDHMQRIDANFKKQYAEAELPQHRVRISQPFLMGMHEVTKGQFAQFVHDQRYQTDAERDGAGGTGYNAQGPVAGTHPQFTWRNTGYAYENDQPVVNVSFNDALAFCQWLSGKERRAYGLPSEAQWEYACRAGTQTLYSHGDDPEGLAVVGNVADGKAKSKFSSWNTISAQDDHIHTAPVGQFRANAFGLCDMHGNVSEWCSDWFVRGYASAATVADPAGPASGALHVVRGGNFELSAGHCRSANRSGRAATGRSASVGFRVVVMP